MARAGQAREGPHVAPDTELGRTRINTENGHGWFHDMIGS
jgi:hypothetical protein